MSDGPIEPESNRAASEDEHKSSLTRTTEQGDAAWDERYAVSEQIWSGEPNVALVAEVDDLEPGTALDVGCGEGADAIWLANRGWQVTAIDVSDIALQRAATAAEQAHVDVA
jgi:2-polyprenyl-3-methyl-5-hydroxy-6-metoxy-1,4-benzoquinol methylase